MYEAMTGRIVSVLLCVIVLADVEISWGQDAVDRTVTRADMPRIPPTEVNDALATFRLAKGFRMELVAAEPLVSDPVDACFDEHGRMFVAEMHGYPFSQEPTQLNPEGGGRKDAGIIRLLEDTDGDGTMDKSTVYADKISWPTSVCCYNGGVFVLAPQYLYYFKDEDGDGHAEIREVVLSGFGRGNVQAVTNGLQWGLDNRIYFAAGRNPAELKHRGKPLMNARGSDIRFDPRQESFEAVTGGLQFGHTQDEWGVRFVCSNSNHIQQVVYPRGYLARNPFYAVSGAIRSIAADGASARVFRRSPPEPWRIIRQKWRAADKGYKLVINEDGGWEFLPLDPSAKKGAVPTEYPVGFFTSATGITIYRGSAWGAEFQGNAVVGDVGGNLVHRKTLDRTRVVYRAQRADEGEELVASSDNWFRPVNFVNAPDGSLYILDMYRETIEHPYSIPAEIKQFLDLNSGHDRGRIYRLVSPKASLLPVTDLGHLETAELVEQLASANGWHRETAQRLLWERQDKSAITPLESLLSRTKNPQARLRALVSLEGLGALTAAHVQRSLADSHPRVRAHAVRLAEPFLRDATAPASWLQPLSTDESEHVRFQTAYSLGEAKDPAAASLLAAMAIDARNGAEIQSAVYSSVGDSAEVVLAEIAATPNAFRNPRAATAVAQLSLIIGANPDPARSVAALEIIADQDDRSVQWRLLVELGRGLSRRGATLSDLLMTDAVSERLQEDIDAISTAAANAALDSETPAAERIAGAQVLGYVDIGRALRVLPLLLSSESPPALQAQAVRSLGRHTADSVADTLLEGWESYSPGVRREVVSVLEVTPARTIALLDAVESGAVGRGDLERTVKQQFLNHRDKRIKQRSQELFCVNVRTNRSAVVAEHQHVLKLDGDASRGMVVFRKTCSVCHKVGDIGFQVAPNLESVKNKSASDLLIAILDPNREAQPNFNTYTVISKQGRTFTGIVAAESAASITLRRAEAKEDVLLRSNVDEMIASGKSLMPEGLEKDLTAQQLADVIAFVRSIGNPVE